MDVQAEGEAVCRAVTLASVAGVGLYVCKVMNKTVAEFIADARRSGD